MLKYKTATDPVIMRAVAIFFLETICVNHLSGLFSCKKGYSPINLTVTMGFGLFSLLFSILSIIIILFNSKVIIRTVEIKNLFVSRMDEV